MLDVLYDCMHYAYVHSRCSVSSQSSFTNALAVLSLHHTKLPQYMREMKKYHLAHHYKNFELGFGVTSTFHIPFLIAHNL